MFLVADIQVGRCYTVNKKFFFFFLPVQGSRVIDPGERSQGVTNGGLAHHSLIFGHLSHLWKLLKKYKN